jgi:hypothetical protein
MSISVTVNSTLRNFYTDNRTLVNKSNRSDTTNGTLSFADATALRKAIRALGNYDYDSVSSTTDKQTLATNLQAFVDTYNYTIESSSSSATSSVSSACKNLKKLTSQYESDLKKLGVSVSSDGYLSLSSTATTNISASKFSDLFGSDSDYMSQMSTYAKRITSHVNVYL